MCAGRPPFCLPPKNNPLHALDQLEQRELKRGQALFVLRFRLLQRVPPSYMTPLASNAYCNQPFFTASKQFQLNLGCTPQPLLLVSQGYMAGGYGTLLSVAEEGDSILIISITEGSILISSGGRGQYPY